MKNIINALNEVMQSATYVQKSSENKFHGYKYASEASLLETLRPAMIKAGLVLIPSVNNVSSIDPHGNTMVTVEYTLAHTSGEVWPDKIVAVGCGNDRNKQGNVGDKGVYKAITGANKYLLFKLFQIETGDDPEKDEAAPQKESASGHVPDANPPASKVKSAPKNKIQPIQLDNELTPAAEDVDKYVQIFVSALEFAQTEKEVREFWKQEAKNRSILTIQENNSEYNEMIAACTKRIETLKGK